MSVFGFFNKRKTKLTDEQKKWNKMWDLWAEGRAASPYAEIMTYQSEVNNGGYSQYFLNTENSGNLQKELAVLETVLPAELRKDLQKAYDAFLKWKSKESNRQAETVLLQCDDSFYKNEEKIDCILREYASQISL